ncbi:DeoR/GlpR transcriptional regulator [Halovulum dunhuangense]|uniref:DeoR/GlpR transcriptional regulator n=1 Tax=Halovulum dunhuangense TaxID=1505036 RepID=A0A849L6I9_9RHOB|nr:DeoR/GlpR transcriptional regulator [Halovulum dunhuangense]
MALSFRQSEIIEIAKAEGKVVVEDLAQRFNVTLQTIRRDLTELAAMGKLDRVHGGAMLASGVTNIEYESRRGLHSDAKEKIARACADRIPDDSSLFLNIGTTTEAVARALLGHRNLMVVTNNINVANTLMGNPECEVIVAGGQLRRSDGGLVGDVTADMVRQFKVDFAVIGASALDEDGDLLDFDYREVRVSQAIIRQARRTILVADSSKFTRSAPVRIGSLNEIDSFITEAEPPEKVRQLCRTGGTEIVIA